jgi:hypothetical protein
MRPDAPEPFGASPFARTIVRRVAKREAFRARRRDSDVPNAEMIAGRTVVADMLVREARPVPSTVALGGVGLIYPFQEGKALPRKKSKKRKRLPS